MAGVENEPYFFKPLLTPHRSCEGGMEPRRSRIGPSIVLLLALTIGGWFLQQGLAQDRAAYLPARLFDEVVDYVADRYVDEVDREDLYDYAIDGILEQLGDPNTSLLSTNAYENFRIQTEGDYGGVGLQIGDRDEYITVESPLSGTPGSRAGIRAGDLIVDVEGESTRDWSAQQAVQVLRGEPGSAVEVLIERPGVQAPIAFTLTREEIRLPSVPFAVLLEGTVGYVLLDLFSESSTREVRAAADSLRAEGATSFILDLRGNPGGVLDQGVGVADLFLDRGADVVETRGEQGGPNGVLRASTPDRYEGIPIAVLVDRGSASASEIVAGALQDHDRALLIGASTYGKGSVQSLYNLSGGNVLKLTTARWYTPLGRSIERPPAAPSRDGSTGEEGHLPITLLGRLALPADTVGRPTVISEAGRSLFGGGGIVPDLLVPMDTLSADEQAAVRIIFQDAAAYNAGLFNYAVTYLQDSPGVELNFDIGEPELDDLYEQLREERDLATERETWERARRYVELDLEQEIALQAWGRVGEFERIIPFDEPLQAALSLLREAESLEDLFSRAGGSLSVRPETASAQGATP